MLTKKCIVCDKEFIKPVNCSLSEWCGGERARRPLGRRFCSKSCTAKYVQNGKETRFKKGQKAINPIEKGQHLSKKTQFKKGFTPWNKGGKMSKDLYEKLERKGFFKPKFGERSANWKGGVTKLGAAIRTMSEYKNWRNSIFKRDDWTCQECGYKGNRLQVHHKKAFYIILDDNNIKNIQDARKCNELWSIDNGITLCIPCHKQTDSYLVNQHTK